MTDKSPASLTSSLLARKGDAASSAEDALSSTGDPLPSTDDLLSASDDPIDMAGDPLDTAGDALPPIDEFDEESNVGGTPVEEDGIGFLNEGPEAVAPAAAARRRIWDEDVVKEERGRPRGRRAPLLVLAVLLVVALAGAAWFAANLFLGGGNEPRVAATKSLIPVGATDGPGAITQPPKAQPPAAAQSEANAPGGMSTPPGAIDPVTNDPQDAPRLASPPGADPTRGGQDAIAAASPTPAPPPPAAVTAPPPVERVVAAPAPPPGPAGKVSEEPPPPPVRAGPSVSAPPPPASPKPASPPVRKAAAKPSGSYSIQLSSVRNRSGAQKEMRRLAARFSDVLAGTPLRVRTANLGKKGIVYRVQSQAILSAAAAKKLCGAMRSKRQPCLVVAR